MLLITSMEVELARAMCVCECEAHHRPSRAHPPCQVVPRLSLLHVHVGVQLPWPACFQLIPEKLKAVGVLPGVVGCQRLISCLRCIEPGSFAQRMY